MACLIGEPVIILERGQTLNNEPAFSAADVLMVYTVVPPRSLLANAAGHHAELFKTGGRLA